MRQAARSSCCCAAPRSRAIATTSLLGVVRVERNGKVFVTKVLSRNLPRRRLGWPTATSSSKSTARDIKVCRRRRWRVEGVCAMATRSRSSTSAARRRTRPSRQSSSSAGDYLNPSPRQRRQRWREARIRGAGLAHLRLEQRQEERRRRRRARTRRARSSSSTASRAGDRVATRGGSPHTRRWKSDTPRRRTWFLFHVQTVFEGEHTNTPERTAQRRRRSHGIEVPVGYRRPRRRCARQPHACSSTAPAERPGPPSLTRKASSASTTSRPPIPQQARRLDRQAPSEQMRKERGREG